MTRINYLGESMLLSADDRGFINFLNTPEEAAKLQTAADFRGELLERMFEQPQIIGPAMRLAKLEDRLRFPGGQVTLWFGPNGHGKSLVTSQVALDMAFLEEPPLICSFEMAPMATLHRMVKQSCGNPAPTRDWVEAFLTWAQGRVWVYNHRGQHAIDTLLKLCEYAAKTKGIKHVFIDSMMKVVKGEEDYDGQKAFIDGCCKLALAANIHVHVVHHVRKGADEFTQPGKYDAKGTGAIADQVDAMVSVWRNKRKEQKVRLGKATEEEMTEPDCILGIDKNRHIEFEGSVGIWYVPGAQSYTDVRGRPLVYPLHSFMPDREVAL